MTNSGAFNRSVRRLKKEISESYGLDPSDPNFKKTFDELVQKMSGDRISKYTDRLLRKYPLDLVNRVFEWAKANCSPAEAETEPFEMLMVRCLSGNPDTTVKDIKHLLDPKTGKLKPFIKEPFSDSDPLRWPDVEKIQKGIVEELPPPAKKKAAPPAMPSEAKLKSMSSDEMAEIIEQARAAGVKE